MIKSVTLRCIILSIFVVGLFSGALPTARAEEDIGLPRLDVVIIVDESGSMWFDTDIERERINAFNLLIDTLGSETSRGDKVRVSVIAFGSAELTEVVLPFTNVNSGTVDAVKKKYQDFNDGLANPPDGEVVGLKWTDALRALQKAEEVLLSGHLSDHKPAIIILSDGKPETEDIHEGTDGFDQNISMYINQMYSQAARFHSPPGGQFHYEGICEPLMPGWVPIYTIGIREGASLPAIYNDIWRKLAEQNGGRYYAEDPQDKLQLGKLGSTYYEIWTDLVCQTSELETGYAPLIREYEVSSLYKRIIFTVLKDNSNIGVEVYRPGATAPMDENDPNLILNRSLKDEVWSIGISEPWAGTWTVKLTGSGEVWFSYDRFTDVFRVERIHPPSNFVPACTPIDIALRIVNSEGTPITDHVERFEVTVETPDEQTLPLGKVSPQQDTFSFHYGNTCVEGDYKFSGVFQIAELESGTTIEWPWQNTIRANLDPYLEIVSPVGGSYHTNEPVPLQVDIKVGPGVDAFTATKNPPVIANVYQNTNPVSGGPYHLVYDGALGPSRMKGSIPSNTLGEGNYVVEFSLELPRDTFVRQSEFMIIAPGASTVAPPTPTELPTNTPAPPPTSTPQPEPTEPPISAGTVVAIMGSLAALGAIGAGAWWYRQLPTMLRFSLEDYNTGVSRMVGTKGGGKFSQTMSFTSHSDQPVKLRFSPGPNIDDLPSTQVTLLNDLDQDTSVQIDNLPLSYRGDSAQITSDSDNLTIDNEQYIVSPL